MIRKPNPTDAYEAYGIRRRLPTVKGKPMRTVSLSRYESTPDGVVGRVVTDSGLQLYSLERPWRNNEKDVSCIPPGVYQCLIVDSPKFGKVYGVTGVKDRTSVLIHAANWVRQLQGCVALGNAVGVVLGINGIMGSRDAVARFMADLDNESFTLTIAWEPDIDPAKS